MDTMLPGRLKYLAGDLYKHASDDGVRDMRILIRISAPPPQRLTC